MTVVGQAGATSEITSASFRNRIQEGLPFVLTTYWGTTVYYDEAMKCLRHGHMHVSETNVCFAGFGTSDSPICEGILLVRGGETFSVLNFDGSPAGQKHGADDALGSAQPMHFYLLGDDEVSVKSRGRFLSADGDGTISLLKTWRRDWEKFRVASMPHSVATSVEDFRCERAPAFQGLHERASSQPTSHMAIRRSPAQSVRGVVLCDGNWLRSYLSTEQFHLIEHLHNRFGFDILDSVANEMQSDEILQVVNRYDIVFTSYERGVTIPLNRVTAFKVFRIDDLTGSDRQVALHRFFASNCDMIVGSYGYDLAKYFPHPSIHWIPYSSAIVEEGGLLPFNEAPIEKLFVSGSIALDRPFRRFVFELDDARLVKLGHPGYHKPQDAVSTDIVRGRYFREIHKYLCAFCDAHSLRYVHRRVFEIASAGTLLLGDDLVEKELGELGFVDGDTCVLSNQGNFLERLDWILAPENRPAVDGIRRRGMELCHDHHLTALRAEELAEAMGAGRSGRRSGGVASRHCR